METIASPVTDRDYNQRSPDILTLKPRKFEARLLSVLTTARYHAAT